MLIPDEALRRITGREALYAFLRDRLGWPVDPEDTFTYTGPQLRGATSTRAQVGQIIPFSAADPFAIMLVEFETQLRRGDLREILRAIRADQRTLGRHAGRKPDEFVFVCAEQGYGGIRFAHFEEREGRQPKLRVFGWERDQTEGTRTLRDFSLPHLAMPARNLLEEPDWAEARPRWMAAWDVEKVTKDFFEEYKQVFGQVEGMIAGVQGDKRLFTQRLLNRLLFIHFLSKKKWLRFHGRTDYLHALWENRQGSGFYDVHLRPLFFGGLNNPEARNLARYYPELAAFIGDVPFLNGGLFEQAEDECRGERVPDEAFGLILGLFARYNFTVTESTPDDIEVAVDPEMLGKVFEELVTGRHETGSYYTPRPVVAFMCREALKGYLTPQPPSLSPDPAPAPGKGGPEPEAVAALVDGHDAGAISVPEARELLRRLAQVKVVDPACGSGAYLLGMLHELHALTRILDTRAEEATARDDYHRKLGVIQSNLYGVDLDEFAVNTARLRLWLSLAVEYEGETPEPLPSLDFKIEQGDSLLAPNPQAGAHDFQGALIGQYQQAKARYADPYHRGDKTALREEIAGLRRDIAAWAHLGQEVQGFDWRVEFAEVLAGGGFDVVLANPPYVRADAQFRHVPDGKARQAEIAVWKAYREKLAKSGIYRTLYEKWDLYIPFLERAHQLLCDGGRMVFIISDAHNTAKYAAKSRRFFVERARVERIDFCSDIDLFDAGVNNTILHFSQAAPAAEHEPLRIRRWGETRDEFEANAQVLPSASQADAGQSLFRPDWQEEGSSTTETVPLERVCYISVGMVIHAHEGKAHRLFRAEDLVSETTDRRHPKPYVEGKDMVRWVVTRVRYLEYGTQRAPSMFRRPTFPELYAVPEKLLSMDLSGTNVKAAYDASRLLHNHSAWSFVPWHYLAGVENASIRKSAKYEHELKRTEPRPPVLRHELESLSRRFDPKYLLAVMNSSYAQAWLAARRRSKLHIYPDDWKPLPVACAAPEEQAAIVALVDEILGLYKEHGYPLPAQPAVRLAELERKINERVAALYGV